MNSVLKIALIVLILMPGQVSAQGNDPTSFVITKEVIEAWTPINKGIRYKNGDDPTWALPDFKDDHWAVIPDWIDGPYSWSPDLTVINEYFREPGISWIRMHVDLAEGMPENYLMSVFQSGASEIYLNGELIYQFGNINSSPDSVVFYNPRGTDRLYISFDRDTTNVIAVRFANVPYEYPVYFLNQRSRFAIWVNGDLSASSLWNAQLIIELYRIAFGAGLILFILFFALYAFFPNQKVNLYFSLTMLAFMFFTQNIATYQDIHVKEIWHQFFQSMFVTLYSGSFLFSLYRAIGKKIGWSYRIIAAIGIINVPLVFLIHIELIAPLYGILLLLESARVSLLTIKSDKGVWVILIASILTQIYWAVFVYLRIFSNANVAGWNLYAPISFSLLPMALAIYIGYKFGLTNRFLQKKLKEVEQLSEEKHEILSNQKKELETQVKQRTADLNKSLQDLKATQSQLIQSEKMASLGELTAGIAHEIQNPLNFVNNFSEVSNELLEEMKSDLAAGNLQQATNTAEDLKQNLEKILHHGKRADGIVKGMLQHSRSGGSDREPTDINQLCDEYLRLAYHGYRAKDKTFNVLFETNFDQSIPKINVVPQDIGRVILNLINNAFYACTDRARSARVETHNDAAPPSNHASPPQDIYQPMVSVSTHNLGDKIEIRVNDNGNGIPDSVKDKIFQPFFTTKPTGQGTGLGLSLSYDIVKAHGGSLELNTTEGTGSEFIIQLWYNP